MSAYFMKIYDEIFSFSLPQRFLQMCLLAAWSEWVCDGRRHYSLDDALWLQIVDI